jgi:hypothetical protein
VYPSVAEYWHIGETTMRFLRIMLLMVRGENSFDIALAVLV